MKAKELIQLFLEQTKLVLLLMSCLLACNFIMQAQTPVLNQSYSFPKETYTLYELSATLQQQADLSVSFDAKKLKSNTKIKLPKRSMNTKELTALLNKNYQIQTKFIGRHIIWQKDYKAIAQAQSKRKIKKQQSFKNNTAKKTKKKAETKTAKVIVTQPKVLSEINIDAKHLDTITVFRDTFSANSGSIAGLGWHVSETPVAKQSDVSEAQHSNEILDRLDNPQIANTGNTWFKRFGLSVNLMADELFYINPGVALHWSNFSITANYAIRSDYTHFRFGLAYQQPLSESISIRAWANYGNIPRQSLIKNYAYDSTIGTPPDSVFTFRVEGAVPYSIEGSLAKAGFNLDWKASHSLEVFAGLSFNRMQTKIFHNETEKAPNLFVPEQAAMTADEFQLLPSVIKLSDDFDFSQSRSIRTWIGVQAGFRFYIFKPKKKYE